MNLPNNRSHLEASILKPTLPAQFYCSAAKVSHDLRNAASKQQQDNDENDYQLNRTELEPETEHWAYFG